MARKFNIIKRGYDPQEVDSYIEELETVILSYKEKDASIKNAILSSQVAGDNIIKNAQHKAEEIIANSLEIVAGITKQISRQRFTVDEFRDEYNEFIKKYISTVNEEDIEAIHAKISSLEQYYSDVLKSIEDQEL